MPVFAAHLDNYIFQEDSCVLVLYFFGIGEIELKNGKKRIGYFYLTRHNYFNIIKDEVRGFTDFLVSLFW